VLLHSNLASRQANKSHKHERIYIIAVVWHSTMTLSDEWLWNPYRFFDLKAHALPWMRCKCGKEMNGEAIRNINNLFDRIARQNISHTKLSDIKAIVSWPSCPSCSCTILTGHDNEVNGWIELIEDLRKMARNETTSKIEVQDIVTQVFTNIHRLENERKETQV
jgi:hypothetical protein